MGCVPLPPCTGRREQKIELLETWPSVLGTQGQGTWHGVRALWGKPWACPLVCCLPRPQVNEGKTDLLHITMGPLYESPLAFFGGRKRLRKKGFILSYSLSMTRWQERELAGHVTSTARKQRSRDSHSRKAERDGCKCLAHSPSCLVRIPMKRGLLHSERIFLPQSSRPRDALTDTQSFASSVTLKLMKTKQYSHRMVFILKHEDKILPRFLLVCLRIRLRLLYEPLKSP